MKTIDAEADRLYKHWKVLETSAKLAKDDLMKHMASLPKGHTSAYCSYVKPGQTIDRSQLGLWGTKYSVAIPMKPGIDWKQYEKDVKAKMDSAERLTLYKIKKAYIRSEKGA